MKLILILLFLASSVFSQEIPKPIVKQIPIEIPVEPTKVVIPSLELLPESNDPMVTIYNEIVLEMRQLKLELKKEREGWRIYCKDSLILKSTEWENYHRATIDELENYYSKQEIMYKVFGGLGMSMGVIGIGSALFTAGSFYSAD